MTSLTPTRRDLMAVLVAVALLAMGPVLRNGWAQDDVDLIAGNASVQQLSGLWTGFVAPWWPPPWTSGLYRPLARSLLTLEWLAGGGAPWVVHLVSLALYAAAVVAFWRLAEELLPAGLAWGTAALFAAHPVHVEAVALGVNQGELVVGILSAFAIRRFVQLQRGGLPALAAWRDILLALTVALLFKEHAAILPLILLAAELCLPTSTIGAGRARWRGHAAAFAIVAAFWAVRTAVLGDLGGAPPAVGIADVGASARFLTMLGVVPTWVRLLLWPAHLQADYSPMEIIPWAGWTSAQSLGVVALLATAGFGIGLRRRAPVARFGLVMIAIALLPVSNLIVPTGVLVAERTLFLPSVGVVLVLGAVAAAFISAAGIPHAQLTLKSLTVLAVAAGAIRSAARMPVWRDQATHITAQLLDAPRSYRAHLAYGSLRYEVLGDRAGGERHLREAIRLAPREPWSYQELADRYRSDGLCAPASALYREALTLAPRRTDIRISLVACLFHTGEWAEAAERARATEIYPNQREWFDGIAALADSAKAADARPGTVGVPQVQDDLARVGRD